MKRILLKVLGLAFIIYSAFIPVYLPDGPSSNAFLTAWGILRWATPQLKTDQIVFYICIALFAGLQIFALLSLMFQRIGFLFIVVAFFLLLSFLYLFIFSNRYYFSFDRTWSIGLVLLFALLDAILLFSNYNLPIEDKLIKK